MSVCQGCGIELPPNGAHPPRKWCSERCRKGQYAGTCVDCGAPTNGSDGRGKNAAKQCAKCQQRSLAQAAWDRAAPQRALVERLWAEGRTSAEIEAVVGWHGKRGCYIGKMRNRGYNLPHRYSSERVANITRGSRPNLVKARAVLAERRKSAT